MQYLEGDDRAGEEIRVTGSYAAENDSDVSAKNKLFKANHPIIAGAVSGTAATILLQPLDVIKTRQQQPLEAGGFSVAGKQHHLRSGYSAIDVARKLLKNEGIRSFWRGLSPSLARILPGTACYFFILNEMSQFYSNYFWMISPSTGSNQTATAENNSHKYVPPLPLWFSVFAAAFARSVACLLLLPITNIKTRAESSWYGGGLWHLVVKTYRMEGVGGYYRGMLATLLRDVPYSGLFYGMYSEMKLLLRVGEELGSSGWFGFVLRSNFAAALLAGFVSSAVTHPLDVVKTRMQLQRLAWRPVIAQQKVEFSRTTAATLRCLVVKEGYASVFRGYGPRIVRRSLAAALTWTLFEKIDVSNLFLNNGK